MLTKELAGLVDDAAQLRQVRDQPDKVVLLCAIIESFLCPDMILTMAEHILRERKIVSTEFCNATRHPDEYEYDPEGDVVKIMVQADDQAIPVDLGDHDSLVIAYHKAPQVHSPSMH